jgi:branched-subunit amino acid transport protein
MNELEATFAILGLAVLTLVSRSFFLLSDRELALPGWARRALKYAPLAALVAICVPDIVMFQGALVATFKDARLAGATVAAGYYFWCRGILGTIITGMAVFLPLRLVLGW